MAAPPKTRKTSGEIEARKPDGDAFGPCVASTIPERGRSAGPRL